MPENNDFDKMIENEVAQLDISYFGNKINPWCTPFKYISWGMALILISFKFLSINVILPVIGYILLYLGTRSLKEENKRFKGAYAVSIILLFFVLAGFAFAGTSNVCLTYSMAVINSLLRIVLLLCLRSGIKLADNKALKKPLSDPFIWCSALIVIMTVLAFISVEYYILPLVLLIAFVITIVKIYKLNKYLNSKGCPVKTSPVKVNNKIIVVSYLLIAFCFFLLGNHTFVKFEPYTQAQSSSAKSILSQKGIDEKVLDCLSESEMTALCESKKITSNQDKMYYHRTKSYIDNGYLTEKVPSYNRNKYAEGKYYIDDTTIYALTDDNILYIINYFEYNNMTSFWNDKFYVWASADNIQIVGGKLFYEKDGATYSAEIPELGFVDYQGISGNEKRISGKVNFPAGSEKRYGYIIYSVNLYEYALNGCSSFDYYHRLFPLTLPLDTQYSWLGSEPSIEMRQHFTNFYVSAKDNELICKG